MKVVRNPAPSLRESPPIAPRRDGAAVSRAQEKAIEKSRIRTFYLECGHPTSIDEQALNDAFRILETGLGPLWYACSHCFWLNKPYWHQRQPQLKTALPPDPLF